MLTQIWGKFNANEKLATIGAGVVLLGFIVGVVLGAGFFGVAGLGTIGPIGAIALPIIYYLKYAPDTKITWPAPIPVIAFIIGAIMAIVGLLVLLDILRVIGLRYYSMQWVVGPIISIVGCGVMAWGTYKEWAATRTTAS